MKKVFLMIIVLGVIASSLFSATSTNIGTNQEYYQLSVLLNKAKLKDIESQQFMIINLSESLSFIEKNMLFEANKKNGWGTAGLNFLLGFGIGSFIQGDATTGLIALIAELVGASVVMGATTQSQLQTGVLLMGAGRLFEVISPFGYANRYNQQLRTSLRF